MDVDDLIRKSFYHDLGDHHKAACKNDQIRLVGLQGLKKRLIEAALFS